MPWLTDPKTGEKSVTLTMFALGSYTAMIKLLLSGVALGGFTMGTFTGADFAAVTGAVGAIYWARKNTDSSKQ